MEKAWDLTKGQHSVLKNEANAQVPELQFVDWPLEPGSRSESITIDSHVKTL